jgi:alkanesulfonate monooxygenase SsuD/methylene tetrahydromethanopterin reductase-like flavin-dependent oxidoreductase (luciferase family)
MNMYVAPTKAEFERNMEASNKERDKRRLALGHPQPTGQAPSDHAPDLYGTPGEVIERIHQVKEEFGADEIMCPIMFALPREKILETMRLFADKVMPEFK